MRNDIYNNENYDVYMQSAPEERPSSFVCGLISFIIGIISIVMCLVLYPVTFIASSESSEILNEVANVSMFVVYTAPVVATPLGIVSLVLNGNPYQIRTNQAKIFAILGITFVGATVALFILWLMISFMHFVVAYNP